MEWGSYDPVVLAAVSLGRGGSLERLVANIDVTSHDVPHHATVAPALGRLVGTQLIETHGDGFRVTPSGRSLLEGVRGGTISRVGEVSARLHQLVPASPVDVLTEEDWDAAVDRYVTRSAARSRSWFWRGPRR